MTNKNGIDELLADYAAKSGSDAAIQKGLQLIFDESQLFNGELQATICGGWLTLGAVKAERGKCRMSAKNEQGEVVAMDVFNPADAARRDKFIKQIVDAIQLTSEGRKEISAELISLASAMDSIFDSTSADNSKNGQSELVVTSFEILSDGRIIEQISGGFAIYDPNTGEYDIIESVMDSSGTIYLPIQDELFQKAGGIQLAESLDEYGSEAELITGIENYLSKYLDLKPLFLKLTALYILFTYIFDSVLELSYLNATGDAGSGKSRFGQTVCLASRRGLSLITPSAASLYRIVDKFKPTLFLDEFNSDVNSDDTAAIIQILNAGFQKTAQIPRQVPTADGKYKTEMFDAFCPKIIGSLKQSASNAFNSRCIEIQMERTTRNDIPLRLSRKLLNDAQAIRNKLTLWRLRNINADFEVKLDKAEAELRESGIMPRSIQINIPLYALIEDENLKTQFKSLLQGRDEVLSEEKQNTIDGEIIKAFHIILFRNGGDAQADEDSEDVVWKIERPEEGKPCEGLRIEKIVSMLNASRPKEKDHLNERYIGKKIAGFGLRSKQILRRASDYHKKSAILFDSHRLAVIFNNYGLPVPGEFSLDQLDQDSNSNMESGLGRSKENQADSQNQTPLDQPKSNNGNTNKKWSNWSKENSGNGSQKQNGLNINSYLPKCGNCNLEMMAMLDNSGYFCPIGCGSIAATV